MSARTQATGNSAFFYGTLMAFPILSRVIYGTTSPEAWQTALLRICPAVLHSYCRHQVRFVDYPGIVPETGKTVRGTYVEGLTDGDIWRLDVFEGNEYKRKKIKVRILTSSGEEGDEEVDTETYVYVAGRENLNDEEWDFQEFVRSKLSRWVGDSKEYSELDGTDPLGGRWWQGGFQAVGVLGDKSESKRDTNTDAIKSCFQSLSGSHNSVA